MSILGGVVMARTLGPAGKGEIAYAMMALGLFVVAIGGLTQALYAAQAVRPFVRDGTASRFVLTDQARFAAKSGLATGAYSIEAPLGYFLFVKLGRPMQIVAIQSASSVACVGVTSSLTYAAVVAAKAFIFMRATGVGTRRLLMIDGDDVRRAPFARRFLGVRG